MENELKFFEYQHLPLELQYISKSFYELADSLTDILPKNGQRDLMIQKLIEAKDCAVRAYL